LKCFVIGGSSFLPQNLVDGTVVAFLHHCRLGQGAMEQPPEYPTLSRRKYGAGKEKGLLMFTLNAEPVSKKADRCPCAASLLTLHTSSV